MITVMFASHNRGEILSRTLDSMTKAKPPLGGWRLIAVDNRSTDDTQAVMLSYKDRLPLEVLYEPEPGKNRALNRAVDVALADGDADLFVFCDDDVLVREDWLVAWRDVVDEHPDCFAFAGLTMPHWPSALPDWIARIGHLGVIYAVHQDPSEGVCDVRSMYGTNMAIRSSIFRDGYRFNAAIGPDGSATYAMGSETEFGVRLAQQGYKCWFTNRAVVQHIIRPEQMEPSWIFQRAYRFGRGAGAMGEPHIMSISPQRLVLKNIAKRLIYPLVLPTLSKSQAELRRWQWAYDRGYEDGTRDRAGRPRH